MQDREDAVPGQRGGSGSGGEWAGAEPEQQQGPGGPQWGSGSGQPWQGEPGGREPWQGQQGGQSGPLPQPGDYGVPAQGWGGTDTARFPKGGYPPAGHAPGPISAGAVAQVKRRPRWKTPLIAAAALVVGIAIGAAAGGSKNDSGSSAASGAGLPASGPTASSSAAAASGAAGAQGAGQSSAAKAPTHTAPAAPATRVVLTVSGEGQKSTKSFTVGAEWSLTYTYNCANMGFQGNFIVTEHGGDNDGVSMLNQLGDKGGDTTYQHDDGGKHSLEIDSECKWTVKVTDGDGG